MMDVVGYALLTKDANGQSAVDLSAFRGKVCRVLEFGPGGGVLVLDPGATGLASFDKQYVRSCFRCACVQDYVCPPGLNHIEQMLYVNRCLNRKGGYTRVVRDMVIAASITRGKFTDDFLWELQ